MYVSVEFKAVLWILCFFPVDYKLQQDLVDPAPPVLLLCANSQVPSANYRLEKVEYCRESEEQEIFNRRKPEIEETLTLPSSNPGLDKLEIFNRRKPETEETLTLPSTCLGLAPAVCSSTNYEERKVPRKYSHGRDPPSILPIALFAILLSSSGVILQQIGENSVENYLEKLTPPVRNDIKLQGSPFQRKKSYIANPGSFLGFLPPTMFQLDGKKEKAANLIGAPPPPPRKNSS